MFDEQLLLVENFLLSFGHGNTYREGIKLIFA
jgi:hypothetical protein